MEENLLNLFKISLLIGMNLDFLSRFLSQLDFLSGLPSAFLIVGLALIIVAFNERRLSLILLPILYILSTLPFATILPPLFMGVKLFTGLFVTLILVLSNRQGAFLPDVPPRNEMIRRLGIAVLVTLILIILASRPSLILPILPKTAVYLNIIILLLSGLGVTGIWLGKDPLSSSVGLLLFLIGFELYHAHINQLPPNHNNTVRNKFQRCPTHRLSSPDTTSLIMDKIMTTL